MYNILFKNMKAKEVMQLLNITRVTLMNYVKKGYIVATKLPSGQYIYDSDSVFKLVRNNKKINIVYARVSTHKQKNNLNTQLNKLKQFCNNNNIHIDKIYSEISSGLDFDRKDFSELLNDVINYKVNTIYITNKDRLSRLSFLTLDKIFNKFGTKIVVIDDDKNHNGDNTELFEELMALTHIFSTTMYSHRKN